MQFDRRSTLPMQPSSYRAAARKLRKFADRLDAVAEAATPRERAAQTLTIRLIHVYAKHLADRYFKRLHG